LTNDDTRFTTTAGNHNQQTRVTSLVHVMSHVDS